MAPLSRRLSAKLQTVFSTRNSATPTLPDDDSVITDTETLVEGTFFFRGTLYLYLSLSSALSWVPGGSLGDKTSAGRRFRRDKHRDSSIAVFIEVYHVYLLVSLCGIGWGQLETVSCLDETH